jgi:hypothetical protein
MRKFAFFGCLVILSLTSCKKERFDMDLLYGSWIRLPDTGHPRPMIDFNVSGDYTYTDFLNIPAGGTAVYRVTIVGEFEIDGYSITLLTLGIQNFEEEPDPGGFPYEGLDVNEGVPIGSFYGSNNSLPIRIGQDVVTITGDESGPVTWDVLDLTESLLEVKAGPDTVRYARR